MKSFQPSIVIEKTVFPTIKIEVNKPGYGRFAFVVWLAKCKDVYWRPW